MADSDDGRKNIEGLLWWSRSSSQLPKMALNVVPFRGEGVWGTRAVVNVVTKVDSNTTFERRNIYG